LLMLTLRLDGVSLPPPPQPATSNPVTTAKPSAASRGRTCDDDIWNSNLSSLDRRRPSRTQRGRTLADPREETGGA